MKILSVEDIHLQKINNVFNNFIDNNYRLEPFKNLEWNTLYINSAPCIDSDSFEDFINFFKLIEEENINIFSYPVKKKDKFLQINIEDNFITYQKGLNDVYMTFDDCILIGERNDWGICTNIDREVLFLGYTVLFNNFVSTIFQYNDFVLNKKEVEAIYNDNVWH